MTMGTKVDLAKEVRRLFDHFDAQRFDEVQAMFSGDAQGVDEISRAWLRSPDAMRDYFAQLEAGGVEQIRSTITDLESRQWGDFGLVTAMVDQTYTLDGEHTKIHSPVSVVFRRATGRWEIILIHAVPLPE